MKSNSQIIHLLQSGRNAEVYQNTLSRLRLDQFDLQAWIYLGQAFVGMNMRYMAQLCLHRAQLLSPNIKGLEKVFRQSQSLPQGSNDNNVLGLLATPSVKVTACVLTKDSQRTIATCLTSLKNAVDELIVVDTGSHDDTVKIVESMGIKIHLYQWNHDFASARNYAQSLAQGQWILMVDSDEVLLKQFAPYVRETAAVYSRSHRTAAIRVTILNEQNGHLLPTRMTRLYPNVDGLRWQGRIHEHLVSDQPLIISDGLLEFTHDGYESSKVNLEDKWKRNVGILKLAIAEDPERVSHYYYLGRELAFLEELDKAQCSFDRALSLLLTRKVTDDFSGRVYSDYVNFLLYKRGNQDQAKIMAEELTKQIPEHPDGWGWLALINNSQELAKKYVKYLVKNRGKYRNNFDLEYKLRSSLPQLFA